MNWLFWVLLVFVVLCVMRGARKGFIKTAVSMVSMILVLLIVSWINPYIGEFLRESTPVYQAVKGQCEVLVQEYLDAAGVSEVIEAAEELPLEMQIAGIESIPLPQSVENALLENNNSEVYKALGIEKFIDYLVSYLAYCVTNGIGFLVSFVVAIILVKMILYAVDVLTDLPVIGFCNTVAGMGLGLVQAILWIWIFFLMVTVFYHSVVGEILIDQIEGSQLLKLLYEKNLLIEVIMSVILG